MTGTKNYRNASQSVDDFDDHDDNGVHNNNHSSNYYDNNDEDTNTCDESKCVSLGLSTDWSNYTCYANINGYFPMMCSNGLQPKIVTDVKPLWDDGRIPDMYKSSPNLLFDYWTGPYYYFTCCPPATATTSNNSTIIKESTTLRRHCSNSTTISHCKNITATDTAAIIAAMNCTDDPSRPYSRKMNTNVCDAGNGEIQSYMCCDSPSPPQQQLDNNNNTKNNYLGEIDCVPYVDEYYQPGSFKNFYGGITVTRCNVTNFTYSKMVNKNESRQLNNNKNDNNASDHVDHYECCKSAGAASSSSGSSTKPETSSFFYQDATFKWTVYPQIVISSIAIIFSLVFILSLSIPLLRVTIQKRRKRRILKECCQQQQSENEYHSSKSSITATTTMKNATERTEQTAIATSSEKKTATRSGTSSSSSSSSSSSNNQNNCCWSSYSTYNLYLVYLTVPHLVYNLYLCGMYSSYAAGKFNPKIYGFIIENRIESDFRGLYLHQTFEGSMLTTCSTANLYINAFVSYEVLLLLQNCRQAIRIRGPPSIRRVTYQGLVAFGIAIVVSIFNYFMKYKAINKAIIYTNTNVTITTDVGKTLLWINFWVTGVLSLFIPAGYLCYVCFVIIKNKLMRDVTGRMKELTLYFCRIIIVFCFVWIPGEILYIYGAYGPAPSTESNPYVNVSYILFAFAPIISLSISLTKSDVRRYVWEFLTLYRRK